MGVGSGGWVKQFNSIKVGITEMLQPAIHMVHVLRSVEAAPYYPQKSAVVTGSPKIVHHMVAELKNPRAQLPRTSGSDPYTTKNQLAKLGSLVALLHQWGW